MAALHTPLESYSILPPWQRVTHFADNLAKELTKEVAIGHPLYSMRVRAVAQRTDTDDVLFEVDSPDFNYAVVHLSWTEAPENDARWPTTELFPTFQAWVERRMIPDNAQLSRQ